MSNPDGHAAATMTLAMIGIKNVKLSQMAVGSEAAVLLPQIAVKSGKAMGEQSRIVTEAEEGRTIDVDVMRIDGSVSEGRKVSVLPLDID